MKNLSRFLIRFRWQWFFGFWLGVTLSAWPADSLVWRNADNRVDAQIDSWNLPKLLQQIAAGSGWQVYLEPGTEYKVSAKFRGFSVSEALSYLLGNLNYALLPQPNSASKLFVYKNSLQDATQLITPPEKGGKMSKTGKPISNELIVALKPDSKETIEELAKRLGAKIVGRVDALKTYRLQFTDETAAQSARAELAKEPDIAQIESNYPMENPAKVDGLSLSSNPPFSLKPSSSTGKSGVIVGLIDTAVQPQGSGFGDFFLPSLQVAGESTLPDGGPTHGTSMSETILHGISLAQPESREVNIRILPVDVYGGNGSTTTFDVASGVYAAIQGGATVINMSLGGEGESPFLHRIIEQGHDQGILFVGAAGNEPTQSPFYPAAYPEVIAVTAGDRKGNIAPYANRGDFVDVIAPGTSVIYFGNQAYLVSGTSASTAYVSGMAAGLAASSGKTIQEVEAKIRAAMSLAPNPSVAAKP
jgi:hypothetical protein